MPATTTPTPSRTPPEASWADEAQVFFDAFALAYASGNGEHLAQFFTSAGILDDRMASLLLEGHDEILRYPVPLFDTPPVTQQLFLTADGAATLVDVHPPESTEIVTDLAVVDLSDGRIGYLVRELTHSDLVSWGFLARDRGDRLRSLYTDYVTAWDSGERERIESVYRAGASRSDGLFGGTWLIGEDWAGSMPSHLTVDAADVGYSPVFGTYRTAENDLTAAVFAAPTNDDPVLAHALFDLSNEHGCQLRLLAEWELDGYLITREEIFYETRSLRACAAGYGLGPLPEGWWTGVELPEAYYEETTTQVRTTTGTIDIINGGRRHVQLLEWALGRFERAGLPAPMINVVAFPPSQWCVQGEGHYFGVAVFEKHQTRVDLCLRETEVCSGPSCDLIRTNARLAILHEFAHVWEHQQLDDATREAFLTERALDLWWEPAPPWAPTDTEEGVEQAADIIAWGLMDEELEMIRIPDTTAELHNGFRLLTGTEPLLKP